MTAQIPAYPVVHAQLAADGSAHVAVAGDHRTIPPGPLDVTRGHVIAYAVTVATRLGRGVRMVTIDPDGRWELVVHPDGQVQPLEPDGTRKRSRNAPPTELILAPPVSARAAAMPPVPIAPPSDIEIVSPLIARLHFTTGDIAEVSNRAIIGRQPDVAPEALRDGIQHIEVRDTTRTMSRVHAEVAWNGGSLWLTDRGSGNGTILYPTTGRFELHPGEPVEVANGDTIEFGAVVRATVRFDDL